MTKAHRRQVKRLMLRLGYRVRVQRVSRRWPGVVCTQPWWRVCVMQTDVVLRVIGHGTSRRAALRNALDEVAAEAPGPRARAPPGRR